MGKLKHFDIGQEFDIFTDDWGCGTAGKGYLFDCTWFDAGLAALVFGGLLIVTQLLSEKNKVYRKLSYTDQFYWSSSVANFVLSIVTASGSMYILSVNSWYLDHPGDPTNNVYSYDNQLNFFAPWMMGFNMGRVIHVVVAIARNLPDNNACDVFPYLLHTLFYFVIIAQKKFGMICVFQMLLQSHHLYTVPRTMMEFTKKDKNLCYNILEWIEFIAKFFLMAFAGPYCLAILWYHWHEMSGFSVISRMTYVFVIGLNTLLFTGDIAFGVYSVYCLLTGQDSKKWFKDFLKRDRRERRRIRRAGYQTVRRSNDLQHDEADDDSDTSSDSELDLGTTTGNMSHTQTELTQRLHTSTTSS